MPSDFLDLPDPLDPLNGDFDFGSNLDDEWDDDEFPDEDEWDDDEFPDDEWDDDEFPDGDDEWVDDGEYDYL
jgi:DNA-directed RNA polymerase subunit delta